MLQDNSFQALGRYQHARRIILGALLAVLFVSLLFVASAMPDKWHESIESGGIALIVIGIAGRLWATLYVGGRKGAEIVDTGPYSVMRNPLYFFSTIAAGGVGGMTGSVTLMVLFAGLCALSFHIVIKREEVFLDAAFGAPYRNYVARVPRFLPNPLLYSDEETVNFRPSRLRQTFVDGLFFFAAFPFFEMVESWQRSGMIPVLLRVP